MNIQGIGSDSYLNYLTGGRKQTVINPVLNRNLGPDTVCISEAAQKKLEVAKGLAEPELNEMGRSIAGRLDAILALDEEALGATTRSQILPGNYERLQLIEAEIRKGNDSQKLQDEKLLLILFGDARELTDQDLAEGREILDELLPSRDESLTFTDLVKALRKAVGMGTGESGQTAEDGTEEPAMSPEMRLMAEKLKEFLEETKGANIAVSLKGDWKETTVSLGPDEKGEQRLGIDISGTIAPAA